MESLMSHNSHILENVIATSSCIGTSNNSTNRIMSPGYPSNYPNNVSCSWGIVAKKGRRLSLRFESFQTESTYDKLAIYDGTNENSIRLETFSGSYFQSGITSSSESFYLEFNSDDDVQFKGFEIEYLLFDKGIAQFIY